MASRDQRESGAAGTSPTALGSPKLDGLQTTLFEVLASRHALLGQMYLGALAAMERGDPESLAQCGHSMRELLEKLPKYFEGVPKERGSITLGDASRNLVQLVELAKKRTNSRTDDKWQGDIDPPLSKLLNRDLEKFIDIVANTRPPRQSERKNLLRKVDDSPLPMPPVVEDMRNNEWEAYIHFFQGVAHHTVEHGVDEVRSRMRPCERFLVDRLVPRTFDDRAEIAAIVAEVERGQ